MAYCILNTGKICNHCGMCDDRCERNPLKVCDNCFACLEENMLEYAEIHITDILTEVDESAFERADLSCLWKNSELQKPQIKVKTLRRVKGNYRNLE